MRRWSPIPSSASLAMQREHHCSGSRAKPRNCDRDVRLPVGWHKGGTFITTRAETEDAGWSAKDRVTRTAWMLVEFPEIVEVVIDQLGRFHDVDVDGIMAKGVLDVPDPLDADAWLSLVGDHERGRRSPAVFESPCSTPQMLVHVAAGHQATGRVPAAAADRSRRDHCSSSAASPLPKRCALAPIRTHEPAATLQ
jgi:hypothetical protein